MKIKNILSLFLFLSLSFFLCLSCVKTDKATQPSIAGTWTVQQLDGNDATAFKATIRWNVVDDMAEGTSGCNFFNVQNTALDTLAQTFKLDVLVTTKIGCAEALGTFENNYYEALRVCDAYVFDGQTLVLNQQGKKRMTLKR